MSIGWFSPDGVMAVGTVALVLVTARMVWLTGRSLQREADEGADRRRVADQETGAAAYALSSRLRTWSDRLRHVKQELAAPRGRLFESLDAEVSTFDRDFAHLNSTAARASAAIHKSAAEATVLFYEAVSDIREVLNNPQTERDLNNGMYPAGMADGDLDGLEGKVQAAADTLYGMAPREMMDLSHLLSGREPDEQES